MVEIPTARICLVRHGETEWNTERRIQGHIDIGLNQTGLRQAALAGRWLRDAGISAVYGSDLTRARVTAQTIAAALGLEMAVVPEMRERCYGIFEGLTYAEAKARYPEAYAAFEARDPDYAYESGESLKALFARVTGKLKEIAAAHPGQNVVVVSHGGVLDIVNRFVRGNPLETPRDFLIPNAGLNWIAAPQGGFLPGAADVTWGIETWGDTAHLEAGALDELPS